MYDEVLVAAKAPETSKETTPGTTATTSANLVSGNGAGENVISAGESTNDQNIPSFGTEKASTEQNPNSVYSQDAENSKDFEPKCDTPRLHFKKPKQKDKSKMKAAAGAKRKINTMGFSIGKGGMISDAADKAKDEDTKDDLNKLGTTKKRDLKDAIKTTTLKPTVKTSIKSDLSVHVVTRWYRSPEIILLERDYGPPIDIWSVG